MPVVLVLLGVLMFIGAFYGMSLTGWAALAAKFRCDIPFTGTLVNPRALLRINNYNYRFTFFLGYDQAGIYLKPHPFNSLFHPALLIPWEEVVEVNDTEYYFTRAAELTIGDPFIANITMRKTDLDNIPIDALSR